MNPDRPPPLRRRRKPGFDYLRAGLRSISTGSKANHAISEAKRFGASGKELGFVLMTIKHRVLLTGRDMREPLDFLQLEALERLNQATGVAASTRMVLEMIDGERAVAKKQAKKVKAEGEKKPSINLKPLRKELAKAINGITSFGWDQNIKTRFYAFKNLMNETQRSECEQVCQWLEAMGEYYMHRARNARSYSQHASQADFSVRCYGAAGHLYGKHGFKEKEFEMQKIGYASNARLGLA